MKVASRYIPESAAEDEESDFLKGVEPAEQGPHVSLTEWAVFDVPSNGAERPWTRHLAGWSCESRRRRVSSPVVEFDPLSATYTTRSGRVYRLVGVPGLRGDGNYFVRQWLAISGMPELKDVTAEAFLAIHDAEVAARKLQ